jgi:hypothetical protein
MKDLAKTGSGGIGGREPDIGELSGLGGNQQPRD